jgi:histone acetyltransferase MCC1
MAHERGSQLDLIDHLDWIETGRNPATADQWSVLDSWFGRSSGGSTPTNRHPLLPPESLRHQRRFRCRMIQPQDRVVIQRLHEEWFPVLYQDEFFDELVQGRMIGSGDPLFTRLAIENDHDHDGDHQHEEEEEEERIVGCVVGSFVNAHLLSRFMQDLLINNLHVHPRMFYIMTLGCVSSARRTGLASTMIEECLAAVEQDVQCGVVYLHVKIDNIAAIRMYEKLGFHRVTEIKNYYTIDETLHNCFLYAKYFHGTYWSTDWWCMRMM